MRHELNVSDVERYRQAGSLPTDWSQAEVARWNRSRALSQRSLRWIEKTILENLGSLLDRFFAVLFWIAVVGVIFIFANIIVAYTSGRVNDILSGAFHAAGL